MYVGPTLAQCRYYRHDVGPVLAQPTLLSDWLSCEEGYPYGWHTQPSQHTSKPQGCVQLGGVLLGCVEFGYVVYRVNRETGADNGCGHNFCSHYSHHICLLSLRNCMYYDNITLHPEMFLGDLNTYLHFMSKTFCKTLVRPVHYQWSYDYSLPLSQWCHSTKVKEYR